MSQEIKIGDQVLVREPIANSRNTLVKLGTVLAFKGEENRTAVVAIESRDPNVSTANYGGLLRESNTSRREVPVVKLELTASRLGGRARVHYNPLQRSVAW
jgi:hypothetical protein